MKRARKLRSEMTLPEIILWTELRKRPGGLKFRRQHGAGVYVLDFYCAQARLAIEVDGLVHEMGRTMDKDQARSAFLRSKGVATTRISARQVLDDRPAVVLRLVDICRGRIEALRKPLHHPVGGPPPPMGEDLA